MDTIIWSPSESLIKTSNIYRLMQRHHIVSYAELLAWSIPDIGRFWDAVMVDLDIQWETPYEAVLDASEGLPWTKWFIGGRTNIVTNCLDRHIPSRANAIAREGEDQAVRTATYLELNREVCRLAGALRREGIRLGDTVGIYMPMTIEMVAVFYASLKIWCHLHSDLLRFCRRSAGQTTAPCRCKDSLYGRRHPAPRKSHRDQTLGR